MSISVSWLQTPMMICQLHMTDKKQEISAYEIQVKNSVI
jgi:hypothetical protein